MVFAFQLEVCQGQIILVYISLIKKFLCTLVWRMSDSDWASCGLFHYSGLPSCSLECFCQFLSLKSHLFARWVVLSWSFVVDLSPSSHHLLYIHCNSCTVVSPVCTSSFHLVVPFYAICAIDQNIALSHQHCSIIWVHLLRLINQY